MAFNIKGAVQAATKDLQNRALAAIILGQSGAGKSALLGTFGCKTLYIYALGESHGPKSAATLGGDNVVPVCINYNDAGKLLVQMDGTTPDYDAIYLNLLSILTSAGSIVNEGIEAIGIDGIPEIEAIIRGSEMWREKCRSGKGAHNTFAEGPAVNEMLRPIFNLLSDLRRNNGIHYAVTCTLSVSDMGDNGEVRIASPQLSTYAVAETVVRQFGDIMVVGRMSKGDLVQHRIQFMTNVTRSSKDVHGQIKKAMNFSPRLEHVTLDKLPDNMGASLAKVIELKSGS